MNNHEMIEMIIAVPIEGAEPTIIQAPDDHLENFQSGTCSEERIENVPTQPGVYRCIVNFSCSSSYDEGVREDEWTYNIVASKKIEMRLEKVKQLSLVTTEVMNEEHARIVVKVLTDHDPSPLFYLHPQPYMRMGERACYCIDISLPGQEILRVQFLARYMINELQCLRFVEKCEAMPKYGITDPSH